MEPINPQKAYPIKLTIEHPRGTHTSKIVKMEKIGFYVEDNNLVLASGTKCRVKFALPGQNVMLETDVLLVRTVDSLMHLGEKDRVSRLLEFHFLNLNEAAAKKIESFLKSIGKK